MKNGFIALFATLLLIGCAETDAEKALAEAKAYYMSEPGYGLQSAPMSSMRGARGMRGLIPEPTSCPDGWDRYEPIGGGVYSWLCCPPGADLVACANFYCGQQQGIPDRGECGVCKKGGDGFLGEPMLDFVREARGAAAEAKDPGGRLIEIPDDSDEQIVVCPKGQTINDNCECEDAPDAAPPEADEVVAL